MADVFAGLPITDAGLAFGYAFGDFASAAERCDRVAEGADGAFAAGSFVLTSAFPFATQGVQAGHVLVMTSHAGAGGKAVAAPDMLAVVSAADGALTLGRYLYPPGQGALPRGVTPTTGLTGVKFFVPSLVAQIAAGYADAVRRLQLAGDLATFDPEDVVTLAADSAMKMLYYGAWRTAKDDVFEAKYRAAEASIEERIQRLSHRDALAAPSAGSSDTGFAASDSCRWFGW